MRSRRMSPAHSFYMNRRGTEPYARWCGRTAGEIPPPTRYSQGRIVQWEFRRNLRQQQAIAVPPKHALGSCGGAARKACRIGRLNTQNRAVFEQDRPERHFGHTGRKPDREVTSMPTQRSQRRFGECSTNTVEHDMKSPVVAHNP